MGLAGCGQPALSSPTAGVPAGPRPDASEPTTAGLRASVEPKDGYRAVYGLIAAARHSVDMSMYELDDPQMQLLLVAAHRRGVTVRVLLDGTYRGETVNQRIPRLESAGVPVRWSPPPTIDHQKTVIVDQREAAVMTGNLTARYYASTRDFVVAV